MNSMLSKLKEKITRGKGVKGVAISIVILIEILAITTVSVLAWVETVSSIKIKGDGVIDTYVFTDAEIGAGKGTIDMGAYFKQSGDMHFAPASSANGTTMYFPQVASTNKYRKGNSSDKNTSYLSATFRVKTATNADFFFTKVPTFSALGSDIRVSITTQSEGSNEAPVTQIYALTKGSSSVVNSTTGGTATATAEAFADHIKGKSSTARIFSVGADETKVVTVNVWLQKKSTDMNSVMAQDIKISDLGIVSSLTPRRVTLVPGSEWNKDRPTYYAWCWNTDTDGKFFKLTDNGDGSYSFDYDGTYKNISFVRAMNDLTTDSPNWDSQVWNQTENLTIPASPVDPTFFITSITGGTGNKSKGIWEEPAIVKLDYVDGSKGLGKLSATWSSYTASGNGQPTQILCRGGSSVTINATANSNYQFEGWYSDAAGTKKMTSPTAASASVTAPTKGNEITYYAKFSEVAIITLVRVVDGTSYSSVAAGTMNITSPGTTTTSGSGSSIQKTVNKGASVTLSATANNGYTFNGFYTTATGGSTVTNPFTANSSVTYYARFTTNSYRVTANAYYSTNGSTYYAGSTGGTVKVGSDTEGATSYQDVKYKGQVTLTASPATSSGYSFVGWYDGTGTSANQLSTEATYTYTLTTAGAVDIYARFNKVNEKTTTIYVAPREDWGDNYYIRLYDDGGNNISTGTTNGFVKANYDSATGYYKATFTSSIPGNFYAILAKNTSYSGQVPGAGQSGVKGTLGNSYIFGSNITSSSSSLTTYTNQRCIWFIINSSSASWIRDDIVNSKDYMNIWANNTNNKMRRINDYTYVFEFSTIPSGTIYFQKCYSGGGIRNGDHEWSATMTSGKNQYTATGWQQGSWTA